MFRAIRAISAGEELQQLPPWRPGAAQSRRCNLGLVGSWMILVEMQILDDFGLNIMLIYAPT